MPHQQTNPASAPRRGPPIVLALDDDTIFLAGIERLSRGLPCTLHRFESPEEALVHVAGTAPHAMLIDLHMPRMSGLTFLRSALPMIEASAMRLYLQSAGPASRTDAAAAADLGAVVVDKRDVLRREWLETLVRHCHRTVPTASLDDMP